MESLIEQIAEHALKFMALPSALLAVVVVIMKLRKEFPFMRITEVQQLEAARMLRSSETADQANVLHPYEKGLLYRILAKSRVVSMHEVARALELPDPHWHIERLASTRRFLDHRRDLDVPLSRFRFRRRYRPPWRRNLAQVLVLIVYFFFGFIAMLPALLAVQYYSLYIPDAKTLEHFFEIAADLLVLLVVTLPFFGYFAWGCLRWLRAMYGAERLVEADRP